jgi:hypothetical protein
LIIDYLQTLESDCTYDQTKIHQFHMNNIYLYDKYKPIYSYDLSAATDRIPIVVQAATFIRLGLPIKLVLSWMIIMVVLPFPSKLGIVRYRVGQGMGMYSS